MKNSSYILSAYSFIFKQTLEQILDCGYNSGDGNPIPSFDENLLINLCSEAQQIFEKEENIIKIDGNFILVGDIHGSLHDLLRILKFIHENDSKVIFLGDYVDRGNFSLECITILFALKVMHPDSFYLLRGNHEFDQLCSLYGFKDEILNYHNPKKTTNSLNQTSDKQNEEYYPDHGHIDCYKYTEKLYEAFVQAFTYLPIGALLNGTTFCIHGGLSPNFELISDIDNQINRPIKTFEECPLLSDLVWGDPSHSGPLFDENPRGRGFLFNGETVRNFLVRNSISRIIRAHQCVRKGAQKVFNDKLITIFSASSYDELMGNSSAILQLFQNNDIINMVTFLPIRRLQKNEAVFFKVQIMDQKSDTNHAYMSLIHPTFFPKAPPLKVPHKNLVPLAAIKSDGRLRRYSDGRISTPLAKYKFTTKPRNFYQFDNNKQLLPTIEPNSEKSSPH